MGAKKSSTGVTQYDFGQDSSVDTNSNAEAAKNLPRDRNAIRVPAPVQHAAGLSKVAGTKDGRATKTRGGSI